MDSELPQMHPPQYQSSHGSLHLDQLNEPHKQCESPKAYIRPIADLPVMAQVLFLPACHTKLVIVLVTWKNDSTFIR